MITALSEEEIQLKIFLVEMAARVCVDFCQNFFAEVGEGTYEALTV